MECFCFGVVDDAAKDRERRVERGRKILTYAECVYVVEGKRIISLVSHAGGNFHV